MKGVTAALFSSTRPKNSENEKISLCLKIGEIEKGDQSWVKKNYSGHKNSVFRGSIPKSDDLFSSSKGKL